HCAGDDHRGGGEAGVRLDVAQMVVRRHRREAERGQGQRQPAERGALLLLLGCHHISSVSLVCGRSPNMTAPSNGGGSPRGSTAAVHRGPGWVRGGGGPRGAFSGEGGGSGRWERKR